MLIVSLSGHDPDVLQSKIERAIRTTILEKEPNLTQSASNYKSSKFVFMFTIIYYYIYSGKWHVLYVWQNQKS